MKDDKKVDGCEQLTGIFEEVMGLLRKEVYDVKNNKPELSNKDYLPTYRVIFSLEDKVTDCTKFDKREENIELLDKAWNLCFDYIDELLGLRVDEDEITN